MSLTIPLPRRDKLETYVDSPMYDCLVPLTSQLSDLKKSMRLLFETPEDSECMNRLHANYCLNAQNQVRIGTHHFQKGTILQFKLPYCALMVVSRVFCMASLGPSISAILEY
jgi:hypothetical protein